MASIIFCIIIVLLYLLINRKRLNIFLYYMIGFYLLVMIGSCLCITTGVYPWYVDLINILLFTLVFLFCVNPFKRISLDIGNLINIDEKMLNRFAIVYVVGFLIYLIVFVPKFIESINSGSYLILYQDMRNGNIDKFANTGEKWLYYFVSRLQYPAMLVGFVFLCKEKIKKGLGMIIAPFTAVSIYAVYIVSRTEIFQIVLLVILLFILFYKQLPKKINYSLITVLSVLIIIIMGFNADITSSRTEYKTDNLWILNYFGRSVLTFNSILEYPCTAKDGIYFFGTQHYFNISHPSYGGHEFVPTFARMYMDFGYLGFLIFILIPKVLPTKIKSIPKFYVVLWIYNTLLLGVMYSNFTISEIIFACIIYALLKVLFMNPKRKMSQYN